MQNDWLKYITIVYEIDVSILKNALLNKKYLNYKYLLFLFALVAGWPCEFYLLGWLHHYKLNYINFIVALF